MSEEPYNARTAATIRCKARRLARRCEFVHDEVEDIEQELVLELLLRWPGFRPELSCANTFATRVINHKAADMIAYRRARKRDVRRGGLALKEDFLVAKPDRDPDLRINLNTLLAELPAEMRALAGRLSFLTITEAAADLGIPRTTLYCRIALLRRIFEEAGLEAYLTRHQENKQG